METVSKGKNNRSEIFQIMNHCFLRRSSSKTQPDCKPDGDIHERPPSDGDIKAVKEIYVKEKA